MCLTPPSQFKWEPYGRGDFRATVGRALWGEKWRNVLEGGPDADKIEVFPLSTLGVCYDWFAGVACAEDADGSHA